MRAQVLAAAAAAALVLAPAAASAQAVALSAKLAGGQGGDPRGSGAASVKIDGTQVCYDMDVDGIATATMAHIHRGATGVSGPVVVPLKTPNGKGRVIGCETTSADVARDILANPAGFYVNVHNAAFPAGAVRGQLRLGGLR